MSVSRSGQNSATGATGRLDRGRQNGRMGQTRNEERTPTTYYDQPMIKKPTWKWPIPFYFFIGGVAGGAALIGAVADLFGGKRHRSTVRHARYLALAMALICPIPLIQDLGRKTRFHHMLRVFKVSSPMSVGTWILTCFGLTSGALAARQAAEDSFIVRRESRIGRMLRLLPGKPLSALHGLLGLGLGGYTGVLLAATAVPLWAAGGLLMGPLFLATAVASGAAALSLIGGVTGRQTEETHRDLATVETISTCAQIGLVAAREMIVPSRIKRPLHRGFWGWMFQVGAVGAGMGGPLALRLGARLSGRRAGRALSMAGATLTLTGALIERFAIAEAGKISADDPVAYQLLSAGQPGDARPTPSSQASHAPKGSAFRSGVSAPEVTG